MKIWIYTSAGGSVKEGRDKNSQGVFPIRGKLPNAFRTPRNKMFENQEIQGIIKCILGNYRKDFDPFKDVPWEKIIVMADGDVDRSETVQKCFSQNHAGILYQVC